jgi:hypothetical protein
MEGITMKKVMLILVAVMLAASTAWAGNIPEFDAVGCDATNVFARTNAAQYGQVIKNTVGPEGPINYFSANFVLPPGFKQEYFKQTAGQLYADPCFGCFGLQSALTDAWNESVYEWYIILQMKPESDLNVNIYDCVLKHNEFSPWGSAEQTGRYRADWGQLFFIPSANPSITVVAYPGEYATPGFSGSFIMDARTLPGLDIVALDDVLYTSKGIWSEGLVMVMPETGKTNASGETTYNLKQGDRIYVKVTIPFNNTCDIRYGADSVIVKYIGIVGTWYYGQICVSGTES